MKRPGTTLLMLAVFTASCGAPPGTRVEEGFWAGTIATDGGVTTVVNESGSVWGGTATLVEEVSIGVEAGDEPYMLGAVRSVAADDDRIYVLDTQAPALRVYGLDGRYLFDIGAEGEGPGEYRQPDGVAVGPDGRIYVRVFSLQRINVYERDGTSLPPLRPSSGRTRLHQGDALRIGGGGVVYTAVSNGYVGLAPDGREVPGYAEPSFAGQPLSVSTAEIPTYSPSTLHVPFSPDTVWQLSPTGALVAGFSAEYRMEIRFHNAVRTVIHRATEPVPVAEDERAWQEKFFQEQLVRRGPVEGTIPPLPTVKPFFSRFITTHDGRIWVVRPGPGERQADCAPFGEGEFALRQRPCWRDTRTVDAFEIDDGRYLGEIDFPARLRIYPEPHIDGDRVIGVYEDEAGTIMVKRYRLVLSE